MSDRPKTRSEDRSLRETEEWLVRAIVAREEAPDVEARVTASAKQSPRDRLHVYRYAYVARLLECLEDDYPAVFFALGQERAEETCRAYVEAHPSTAFSLNVFGRHMSAFLKTRGEAFAADLAALEWSIVEAIHSAEAPKMAPDALAALDPAEWGSVTLVAAPSLRLHAFDYPADAYYKAFHADAAPAPPAPEPSWLAVYRAGMKIWRMPLSRGQYALLAPLARGASLEEAFEVDAGEAADVGAWFRQWTAEGFFSAVARR
ncbi:MAG: putative DNA-binding domain-containing protein [Labilithrix sp.]|nr:putative DNA-binding domain-containing protein [Labilithrix sp.]MCW5812222.1 putative DNA-binding domain-containing protein [Labilithrix sp.]